MRETWVKDVPTFHIASSVTRWRKIIFPIFGHLLQRKYAKRPLKISKEGSKIGQILNKPSKNYQIL